MTCHQLALISEARLLLRWAAKDLSVNERYALELWMHEVPMRSTARISRQGLNMARERAIRKIRVRLKRAGITSSLAIVEDR